MFPPRCNQPPWRNAAVTRVIRTDGWAPGAPCSAAVIWAGTTAQRLRKASRSGPRASSYRKTSTLAAISARLTHGVPEVLGLSFSGSMPSPFRTDYTVRRKRKARRAIQTPRRRDGDRDWLGSDPRTVVRRAPGGRARGGPAGLREHVDAGRSRDRRLSSVRAVVADQRRGGRGRIVDRHQRGAGAVLDGATPRRHGGHPGNSLRRPV